MEHFIKFWNFSYNVLWWNKDKKTFKNLYPNINPDNSVTEDLKYQNWLVTTLMNNPESLVTIEAAYKDLTAEQKNELIGNQLWAAQNKTARD